MNTKHKAVDDERSKLMKKDLPFGDCEFCDLNEESWQNGYNAATKLTYEKVRQAFHKHIITNDIESSIEFYNICKELGLK